MSYSWRWSYPSNVDIPLVRLVLRKSESEGRKLDIKRSKPYWGKQCRFLRLSLLMFHRSTTDCPSHVLEAHYWQSRSFGWYVCMVVSNYGTFTKVQND